MAKRFYLTDRIEQEWYQGLSLIQREFLRYAESKCDNAGVFVFVPKISLAYLGEIISEEEILQIPLIIKLDNGKFLIHTFMKEQYISLSDKSPAHKPVMASISDNCLHHVIELSSLSLRKSKEIYTLTDTLSNRVLDTLQDKDKDKAKDKAEAKASEPEPFIFPENPNLIELAWGEFKTIYPQDTGIGATFHYFKAVCIDENIPPHQILMRAKDYHDFLLKTDVPRSMWKHPKTWLMEKFYDKDWKKETADQLAEKAKFAQKGKLPTPKYEPIKPR